MRGRDYSDQQAIAANQNIKERNYWLDKLSGNLVKSSFPYDYNRIEESADSLGMVNFTFSGELYSTLLKMSNQRDHTLHMILVTGIVILLDKYNYNSSKDIIVGAPIYKQERETEFINTVVALRNRIEEGMTFKDLLVQVRQTIIEADKNQNYPIEILVQQLNIENPGKGFPLFDVAVLIQNIHNKKYLQGIKTNMTLLFSRTNEFIEGVLEYNAGLYRESTVERIANHLRNLLQNALVDVEGKISEVDILSTQERKQLLYDFNDNDADFSRDKTIYQFIEDHGETKPERAAVIFAGERVSYRELNEKANQLASVLRDVGVHVDQPVGILLHRSPLMVESILAVWKAGGAYIPIDTQYPAQRIKDILNDSGCNVLITRSQYIDADLQTEYKGRIIQLDTQAADIARKRKRNPGLELNMDSLSYIIYTSGSTGKPKGVMVEHIGMMNHIQAKINDLQITGKSIVAQNATHCFDISVWQFFVALTVGGKTVIYPNSLVLEPDQLMNRVMEDGVTILEVVPSYLSVMLSTLEVSARNFEYLQYLLVTGEAVNPNLLEQWFKKYPGIKVVNAYGPTEASDDITHFIMDKTPEMERIPIGKPLQNLNIYIVNPDMQLCPIGIIGEIWVSGVGVGRGYIRNKEKTQQAFMEDPFIGKEGIRLYKTGDLGRWLPDGNIDFLGRIDDQVKVRGFRIECGEIESVLLKHEKVKEAVVVTREDEKKNNYLAAYVVIDKEERLDTNQLRDYVKETLPDYMVPGYFVQLDRLPLTDSGKINKRALPEPEITPAAGTRYEMPRNETEAVLAKIWQEVLDIDRIGIHDNFFNLGGDSIKGIRVVNKIQRRLEEIIHVSMIFEAPTIKELAACLESYKDRKGTRINAAKLAEFREVIRPLPSLKTTAPKNPPAVFILSAPRTGSTLLRVILAGHSRIFAPQELELLLFNTLQDRKAELSGHFRHFTEGTIRAIMEIKSCGPEEGKTIMQEFEKQNLTTQQFYGKIQQWLGNKLLVDKTANYALNPEALKRAEKYFESPLYIHLTRHPYAVIHSYEEAKLDQVFRYKHNFSLRELAELVWLLSEQSIREFLKEIPGNRKHFVRFEELVFEPASVVNGICEFLGLAFEEEMIQVYKDTEKKMTDGIYAESRMIGDVKFFQHSTIDASVVDKWQGKLPGDFLGDISLEMAQSLGYLAEVGVSGYAEIELAEESGYYPLSHAQKRLWILDQFENVQTAYIIPAAYIIEGELDIEALENAFLSIIKRHESLRTTFILVEGEPKQKIQDLASTKFRLESVDLSGKGERYGDEHIENLVSQEAETSFNLASSPLIRAKLMRLEHNKHLFLLTMHHIISDGWSIGILVKELLSLYEAYKEDKDNPLLPLMLQYKDYSLWQNSEKQQAVLSIQESYWKKQFVGEIPVLDLPTDYPRPGIQSFAGSRVSFEIGREETGKLNALAEEEGVTTYMILLAIYNIFLSKISNREVIVTGTPVAGRKHADVENIIGMFVNTLALKSYPLGEKTFIEFLKQTGEKALEIFENQDYPYENLVEQLSVPRETARNPLFDVMFVMQNVDVKELEIPGLRLIPYQYESKTAKFDLMLVAIEARENLQFTFEYCTRLFKEETIRRFSRYFMKIAAGILAKPAIKLSEIEIISETEKRQILTEFNDTVSNYPSDKWIHQLFEEEVEKRPEKVAVVYEDEALTYRVLNRRADKLASILRGRGVKSEEPVGIKSETCLEMIVGVLAILKAGGAYLPIDPDYPQERIDFMLEDSNARVLLKKSEIRISKFETNPNDRNSNDQNEVTTSIVLDFEHLNFEFVSDFEFRASNLSSSNLAYIIYTSGSTGRPKGVLVGHGNVIRLVKNTNYVTFREGDRILQTGALEFDASTFEIWGTLLNGLTLYLAPKDKLLTPGKLKHTINVKHITTMWMTSPLFNQMVQSDVEIFAGLQNLLVGGDVLSPAHINQVRERFPRLNIINGYGPTENTTFSTTFLIEEEYRENIPIGKPIANSTAYIVDREGILQPIGIAGELLVGGDGAARGYLNNPELTAEKFFSFSYRSYRSYRSYKSYISKKIYKTGDLARWLADGNIQFLGRMDQQVKIRGFRIEPGEIETHLLKHGDIKETVVVAKDDHKGDKYLCAYIVSGNEISAAGLRKFLSKDLPDYMIPSYFVPLEEIPLTPNGKVDWRALPEPQIEVLGDRYTAPRDEIEEALAKIWADILGIEKDVIGIDSDFFDLGGHSIKATLMAAKIHKEMHINVSLTEIFTTPTVSGLAQCIKQSVKDKFKPINKAEKRDYYLLSSAQRRLFVLQQMDRQGIGYNIPSVLRVEGNVDMKRLEDTFKRLLKRHESLRTSFKMVEKEPVQKIHDPEDVEFRIEYYEVERREEGQRGTKDVEELIRHFIRPFDLSCAPLLRVGMIHTPAFGHPSQEGISGDEHILMVDIHHIISDGISREILVKDFMDLYAGEELPLLRIQYKDFSRWQHSDKEKQSIQRQKEYWQNQFESEVPVLNLPTDFARPAVQSFNGANLDFEIGGEGAGILKKLAFEEETTLYMLLLVIYNIFLSKICNQEDIIVGTPIAGRRHADLEHIMGMFVNSLALRNYPKGNRSFREFLREVKTKTLEAFENQDYQFEDLVETIAVKRDSGRNPLFDTMFALQNLEIPQIEISGLKLLPYEYEDRISKFDLTLIGTEIEEKIRFIFQYSTVLFAEDSIRKFIRYFKEIVSSVLNNPGIKISEIEILSDEEKYQLLVEFNKNIGEYLGDKTIFELFEEQVEKTPDQIALIGSWQLAVGKEESKSAAVSGHLITYRELKEKSNQLAHLLKQEGVKPYENTIVAIITECSIEMVVGIFAILKSGGAYIPLEADITSWWLNCILKDSGCKMLVTDKKGTSLVVGGIPLLILDINENPGSISAVSLENPEPVNKPGELACVVYERDPSGFPRGLMIEHRGLANLVEDTKRESNGDGRWLEILVELSSPLFYDAFLKKLSCYKRFILDSYMNLLPKGTGGEIYVGARGLGCGYLNCPGLTAKKFIKNPFDENSQDLLYRTEDIGRHLPDGIIDFIGRRDDQLEIGGYRIEPGEIQFHILSYEGVREAAVVPDSNHEGKEVLIAYYVKSSENHTVDVIELKEFLSRRLPAYMIPVSFVELKELPLTSGGRIDRSALPRPVVGPRNKIERKLAAIWSQLLGKEVIDVTSDFFQSGGNSIKALLLVLGINREFDVSLLITDIFELMTIEKLAGYLTDLQPGSSAPLGIREMEEREYYEVSHAQRRLWVLCQFEESSVAYNMPGAFIFKGALNQESLRQAFETLVERHEILRTVFITVDGEPKQKIAGKEEIGFTFEEIDLKEDVNREEKAKALADKEGRRVFDLSKGPLLIARLLRLEDEKYHFLLNMHHIISDGWSAGILIKEVCMVYNAATHGGESSPEPLKIQYKDYSAWQNKQLEGEELINHRDYWLDQFSEGVSVLELPCDYPRPKVKTYNGDTLSFMFSSELSQKIYDLASLGSTSLFIKLMGSVKALLYRYSGQEDFVIGSFTSGRHHKDLEDQIGFYVNTLALRTVFKGSDSFECLLGKVKETLLATYDHEVYPFDQLVDELGLDHDTSRSPLFDVAISLNPEIGDILEKGMEGVSTEGYKVNSKISKFDLLFIFTELSEGIHVTWEYNTDLFSKERIQRMCSHYQRLFTSIVNDSKAPLNRLNYLSDEEKHQILHKFNDMDTGRDYPKDKTIHELFAAQARQSPDDPALVSPGTAISYRQLNEQSNQLAHYLKVSYQIGVNDLVLLQLESIESLIISLFAVLKSGGAFILVEPDIPRWRMNYILKDSGCKMLVMDKKETSPLPGEVPIPILDINEDTGSIAASSIENLESVNRPGDLVCVVYESDPEGFPRGLMIEHQDLVNLVKDIKREHSGDSPLPEVLSVLSSTPPFSLDTFLKKLSCYQSFILDSNRNLVPIGVNGEIYIRVCRGYLNRPGLTAEKFIRNPFVDDHQDILCRTGDMGRYLPDGNVGFMGRRDDQLKIGGYRIEPGEIRFHMSGFEGVKEAVVMLSKGHDGEEVLTAYYVKSSRVAVADVNELKEFLSNRLPAYMIPVNLIELEKIPLTAKGQIDRSALPAHFVGPRSEIERKLAVIWSKILGEENIGVTSDFFQLGGNSIKALLLVSEINEAFDVTLLITDIFELQTIEKLAVYLSDLQPGSIAPAAIDEIEKREYYEESHAQRRLWVLCQFEESSLAYNMPAAFILKGALNQKALCRAFEMLAERHEILRTVFITVEGEPRQKILGQEEIDFAFEKIDLRKDAHRYKIAKAAANEEGNRVFNLSKGPLITAKLVQLEDECFFFLLNMHHIISDGWSMGVLIKDVFMLYNAAFNGEEGPLLPLRIQYKDFSAWQNKQLEGKELINHRDYWLNQFKVDVPVLELPCDYPRPKVKTYNGDTLSFSLPFELSQEIIELSRLHGTSMFIVLLASVKALLYRYTGQEDIVIGSPISGRLHSDLENQIGFYVNTLPLRTVFNGSESFEYLLGQVKETSLAAYNHEVYPFDQLVDELELDRNTSRSPLFDVMVTLNPEISDIPAKGMEGITIEGDRFDSKISKFDLTVAFADLSEGIQVSIEYNTDLFNKSRIQQMGSHYQQLLDSILSSSKTPLNKLNYLSEAEIHQLLVEFNDTERDYPKAKTIHELFAEQAEKTPDNLAVVGVVAGVGNAALTYREMNKRSSQLSRRLRQKGLTSDTIVGIMIERSIEMIIGILAILKAGSAYLPIDPGYPGERIHYMLRDSKAKVLLSEVSKVSKVSGGTEVMDLPSLVVETEDAETTHLTHLTHPTHPTQLCYVIYTSGSTGKPKGVLVEHCSVINRLNWMQRAYPLEENDKILQKTPITFDVSVWELFWWSFQGASLYLLGPGDEKNPEAIVKAVQQQAVTTLHFVPSMLNAFLDYIENHGDALNLTSICQVFSSGEALGVEQVKRFNRLLYWNELNNARLINLYGPTEATVDVSFFNCDLGENQIPKRIPIGKPIDNIQLVILDRYLKLLPVGIAGELCIAGVGVARGYLNKPQLTAEKFGHDLNKKFLRGPGAVFSKSAPGRRRLYKTGDLARWLRDGIIEFLGRLDYQVKIRGFRIELGEIKNRLLKHQDINEAVVQCREDDKGDKYLCAYVVPQHLENFQEIEVRDFLSEELPEYMIPSYFVTLEALPLSPSGKVDRKALPTPAVRAGVGYTPPENELEVRLVQLWSEILGIGQVIIGTDDNFFHLGGHSLKAVRMVSRIHKEFSTEISISEVFKSPTIRGISGYIRASRDTLYPSIEPVEKKEYYQLSSAQKRLYILQQMMLESTAYNMPQSFPLYEGADIERLESVFRELINRHESFRTSFHMLHDEPVQKIHDEVEFEIAYYDTESRGGSLWPPSDQERGKHGELPLHQDQIIQDFVRPFNLSWEPLLRVELIKTTNSKHLLLLDMHHIIMDGTSQDILRREFLALYSGDTLSPLRLQYKDFSGWQNSEKQKELIKQQEFFWVNQFSDELPVLNLPFDYPRPLMQSFEGNAVDFVLTEKETRILKHMAKEIGGTLYMSILAVYTVLLSKLSSQEDIIVGTPIAARRHADLEHIIGMFANTLAMRNYPSADKIFKEFLIEVKERTLEVFENQEYQFEDLVDQVSIQRDTSRNPIFDVMFNLMNLVDYPNQLPQNSEQNRDEYEYAHERITAKFDLNLAAVEMGERILFNFEYCTRLFEASTIARFIGWFRNLLSLLSEDAEVKLAHLDMLTAAEKEDILKISRGVQEAYDDETEQTIPGWFEEQAAKTPDHIAVVAVEQDDMANHQHPASISYRELNRRANQLAKHLRKQGVKQDTVVVIMVDRSVEMIIAVLAIMKAGGAYLPIDAQYPKERKRHMLEDSGAALLLTNVEVEHVADFEPEEIDIIDIRDETIYHGDDGNPEHVNTLTGSNLLYVIYTSGSTGTPKGVMLEHRNLVNLLRYQYKYTNIDFNRILQFTTISFDVSFQEIFSALLAGGRLYLINREAQGNIPELFDYIEKNEIKTLFLPMTFLRMVFNEDQFIANFPNCVKHIITAGEQVICGDKFRHCLKEHQVYLHNHYGPAESHVVTTLTLDPAGEIPEFPSIGKPILNTNIYILDKGIQLVPLGVVGEVFIGGIQVGRGYWRREELTAERFISSPFTVGERLYRTGDLAKWLPDGNIEFLGRVDHQVKIRGFRVEMGEIESRLLDHPGIKETVVVSRVDEKGDKYLCAYFVSDEKPGISELREYLAKSLPVYMIPAYFVMLEKIPLTPNNKIDQRALPAPELKAGEEYIAPRDAIEEKLAALWSDILEVEKNIIGIDSNFFELGGHSLKATILTTRIHKELNVKLPLAEIFKNPTIRGIASLVDAFDWIQDQKIDKDQKREEILL